MIFPLAGGSVLLTRSNIVNVHLLRAERAPNASMRYVELYRAAQAGYGKIAKYQLAIIRHERDQARCKMRSELLSLVRHLIRQAKIAAEKGDFGKQLHRLRAAEIWASHGIDCWPATFSPLHEEVLAGLARTERWLSSLGSIDYQLATELTRSQEVWTALYRLKRNIGRFRLPWH